MELKSYQRKVIENLEEYLGYVQEHKLTYRYIGGPLKTVITQDTTYHLSNLPK